MDIAADSAGGLDAGHCISGYGMRIVARSVRSMVAAGAVIPLHGIVPQNQGPLGLAILRELPQEIMDLVMGKTLKNMRNSAACPLWD